VVAAVIFTRESKGRIAKDAEETVLEGSTLERAIPALARQRRGGLATALFSGHLRRARTQVSS
jgi:hypothetical protein